MSTTQNIPVRSNIATSLSSIQLNMLHKTHSYDGINVEHISNIPENILNSHAYMVPNNAKRLWLESANYNNYRAPPRGRHGNGPPQLSPVATFSSKNDLAAVYNRGQKRMLAHTDLGMARCEVERSDRLNYENDTHKYPRKRFKSGQELNHMAECEEMVVSKDHLNQRIMKIEREIYSIETNLGKLKSIQDELHKGRKNVDKVVDHSIPFLNFESRPLPIARHIYEENTVKAKQSHGTLLKSCKLHEITAPMYSQPSDTLVFKENQEKFIAFKKHLVAFLSKRRQAENIRLRYLSERYNQLQQQWAKKMEKKENSALRKEKDSKYRECFERVFPELKKIKEEKDKIQKFAAAQSSRPSIYARSDALFDDIVNGLREQEMKEQRMRSLSVVPPLLLDSRRRSMRFIDESRQLRPEDVGVSSMSRLRDWFVGDQDTFVEKFGQYPKKFHVIASFFDNKTVQDCVWFYYITKKDANYKQIVRRFIKEQKKKRSAPDLAANYRNSSPSVGNNNNVNEIDCTENFENKDVPFKIGDQDNEEIKNSEIKIETENKEETIVDEKVSLVDLEEAKILPKSPHLDDVPKELEIKVEILSEKEHSERENDLNADAANKINSSIDNKEHVKALNHAVDTSPLLERIPIPANVSIQKLMNASNLKEGGYVIPSLEDVSDTDSVDTDTADEGDNDSPTRRGKNHKTTTSSGDVVAAETTAMSSSAAPKKTIIRDLIHAIIEGNLQSEARMTPNTKGSEDWQLIAPRKSSVYSDPLRNSDVSMVKIIPHHQNSPSPSRQQRISLPPNISTPHSSMPVPSSKTMMHSKLYQQQQQQQQQNTDDPLNQLATVALQIGPIVCHNDSKKIVPPIACRGSITQGTSGNVNKSKMNTLKQYMPPIEFQQLDSRYKNMAGTPPIKQVDNTDSLRHDFKTALQMRGAGMPMVVGKSEMQSLVYEHPSMLVHPSHHHQEITRFHAYEQEDNRDRIQTTFKKTMMDSIPKSTGGRASNGDTPHITAAYLIEAIIAMQINQSDPNNKDILPAMHQAKSANGVDMKPDLILSTSNNSILHRIDASNTKKKKVPTATLR